MLVSRVCLGLNVCKISPQHQHWRGGGEETAKRFNSYDCECSLVIMRKLSRRAVNQNVV